ncbi:C40 family peptidase [Nocardioides sp. Y6]|uniref:C40 family peptidase n=1 Tax=Nocardioides malaquae TaxID=2773426 RepID=A0ABR9RV63_9ACTN|nr:C40 family peptidase [Nocardioides malaquae]MBE7325489.1 C40 family peptidase [Nocardioides malaquae]
MRQRRRAPLVAAGVVGALTSVLLATNVSFADEPTPSREEVRAARDAADDKARDVAGVQAELALANVELEESAVAAAQASEAYNGALWQLEEARREAAAARRAARSAGHDVRRQQREYGDALVRSYQASPEIAGVAAVLDADGIESFVEQRVSMDHAVDAMEGRYQQFRASSLVAEISSGRAAESRAAAQELEAEARELRDAASRAAASAATRAEEIAARKSELLAELAELEGISVALAERRQRALEQQAAEEAARARQQEQERDAEPPADPPAEPQPGPAPAPAPEETPEPRPELTPSPRPEPRPSPSPSTPPAPAPAPPAPAPAPPAPAPPAPARGASAAVAFAERQLGEPYVWGAAGPNAWDCSGLTMQAWAQGGKSLPHWSVGQYRATTPVKASALRAGDLVFWSSSSNPDTIFHVALYVGDGMIVHAPRTGRPVVKESMYYWRSPNFFTRP